MDVTATIFFLVFFSKRTFRNHYCLTSFNDQSELHASDTQFYQIGFDTGEDLLEPASNIR